MAASAAMLSDHRMHLHHGPIDLIVDIDGSAAEMAEAFVAMRARFESLLTELVAELREARQPTVPWRRFRSAVAERMQNAAAMFLPAFSTPMIAVAGSVAEEIRDVACAGRTLRRVVVNNGGDISLHLGPGTTLRVGVVSGTDGGGPLATILVRAEDGLTGVATSGWRGRSHSLGIADSVTTIARTAPIADTAATLVANAVDLPGHPSITRRAARELDGSSDLRDHLVTVDVGVLSPGDVEQALRAGADRAARFVERGLLAGAVLTLAGTVVTVGDVDLTPAGVAVVSADLRE